MVNITSDSIGAVIVAKSEGESNLYQTGTGKELNQTLTS